MALLLCSGILLLLGLVQHYLRAIPWTWLPSHLVAHRHGAQLSHQATTGLMATVLQGRHHMRGFDGGMGEPPARGQQPAQHQPAC